MVYLEDRPEIGHETLLSGAFEASRAGLESFKERGTSALSSQRAPFSLRTRCPSLHPRSGVVAEGLSRPVDLCGSEMPQVISVALGHSHTALLELIAWGMGSQATSLGRSWGWLFPLRGLGSTLCCLTVLIQGMSPLAGFSLLILTLPL